MWRFYAADAERFRTTESFLSGAGLEVFKVSAARRSRVSNSRSDTGPLRIDTLDCVTISPSHPSHNQEGPFFSLEGA